MSNSSTEVSGTGRQQSHVSSTVNIISSSVMMSDVTLREAWWEISPFLPSPGQTLPLSDGSSFWLSSVLRPEGGAVWAEFHQPEVHLTKTKKKKNETIMCCLVGWFSSSGVRQQLCTWFQISLSVWRDILLSNQEGHPSVQSGQQIYRQTDRQVTDRHGKWSVWNWNLYFDMISK